MENQVDEQINDTTVGTDPEDKGLMINLRNPFISLDWDFMLDQDAGFKIIKSVVSIINRLQSVGDLYEKCDDKDQAAIDLATDIASVVNDVGTVLCGMASVDEVLHVSDLMCMYAHMISVVTNSPGDAEIKWANEMDQKIRISEQSISFVRTEDNEDFWHCSDCRKEFITHQYSEQIDDFSSRFCPYCGVYQESIIR